MYTGGQREHCWKGRCVLRYLHLDFSVLLRRGQASDFPFSSLRHIANSPPVFLLFCPLLLSFLPCFCLPRSAFASLCPTLSPPVYSLLSVAPLVSLFLRPFLFLFVSSWSSLYPSAYTCRFLSVSSLRVLLCSCLFLSRSAFGPILGLSRPYTLLSLMQITAAYSFPLQH